MFYMQFVILKCSCPGFIYFNQCSFPSLFQILEFSFLIDKAFISILQNTNFIFNFPRKLNFEFTKSH